MKTEIYINRHIVAANKKATRATGELVDEPAITLRTYKGTMRVKRVEIIGSAVLVQDAARARCSGATIWLECDSSALRFEE